MPPKTLTTVSLIKIKIVTSSVFKVVQTLALGGQQALMDRQGILPFHINSLKVAAKIDIYLWQITNKTR